MLNTAVISIDKKNKKAKLSNEMEIEYEYLINTIPLNKFLNIHKGYDSLIEKMSYNKVLVFNLGFDKKSPLCTKEHWLYIPSKECNFYRCGFYDNILGTDKLSMYIEIGYNKNDEITEEEINKQLKLTLENLLHMGIITENMNLKEYVSLIISEGFSAEYATFKTSAKLK